jgi:Permuted papain-like amidase enzyme, YaeF/YiiX, C92 family
MTRPKSAFWIPILLLISSPLAQSTAGSRMEHRLDPAKLQDGDILFIRSHSPRSDTIAKLTHSKFTHCGIVFRVNGDWKIYEGAGRQTAYLSLNDWQDDESPQDDAGHVINYEPVSVRRLKDLRSWSNQEKAKKLATLQSEAKKLHETCYDLAFAWNNHYEPKRGDCVYKETGSKEYVYCSELVYKAFERAFGVKLAAPKTIKSYHLDEKAIAFLNCDEARSERGGKNYNPNELVVSPQDLFVSDKLEAVDAEAKSVTTKSHK